MAASAPAPPYTECPAIGDDTSCGILINVTNGGQVVAADSSQGPYDGSDDTLVGVLNSSSSTLTSLQLSSTNDIFGFDGDGICTGGYPGAPAGCPFGPTGYEGPGTSFSNANASQTAGTVNFSPGIAPGGTAYFSLEEPLTAATVFSGGPSASEQGQAPNESEKSTTCSTKAPVNCATGTFWHTFTDASVAGNGPPLTFSRTYSSAMAQTNGPLGYGWTDSFDMSLSFDAAGNATVTQEDGSTVPFDLSGGSYIAPPWVLASLVANGDGTYTFTRDASNVAYVFNSSGQLVSETDRNGYALMLAYSGGNLTSVTDQAGRALTFAYSGGHLSSVTDPMGHTTSFSYDMAGDLTGTTDPMGRSWSFGYDSNHLLTTMTDPMGGSTTNTYNGAGQVIAQSDPLGRQTTWSYNGDPTSPSGSTTTITDPRGIQTVENYSDMELTSITHGAGTPQAATTSYQYDPASLGRSQITDPDGKVTTNTYDSRGDLTSTTDPDGNVTTNTYDGYGDLTSTTDPLGITTSYSYDGNGNLTSQSTPLTNGATAAETYSYGTGATAGDVLTATDADDNTTTFGYNSAGNRTSETDALGKQTTATFNADGQQLTAVSPNGGTTTNVYDADGELTKTTNALGDSTSYSYDPNGNQSSVTNAAGNTTTYRYDADNEQVAIVRPDGSTSKTSYDADGNVTAQTNGGGATTTYSYDPLNRVTSTTSPDGETTTDQYDGDGNLVASIDPSCQTVSYSYNGDGLVTSIRYSDGTTPNVSETYNADGERTSMTDGTGTSSFSYDTLGNLASQTNGAGATTSYSYDAAGNVTSITYPNGQTVTRTFDADNRLASVSDWLGNTTSFSYDGDGNLTQEALPGSVTSHDAYNAADELTSITDANGSGPLATFSYTRDALGQVTSSNSSGAVSGSDNYSYDAENRLVGDNGAATSYDSADNPTSFQGNRQTFNADGEVLSTGSAPAGPVTRPASCSPGGGGTSSGGGTGNGGTDTHVSTGDGGNPPVVVGVTHGRTSANGLSVNAHVTTKTAGERLLAFLSTQRRGRGQQTATTPRGGRVHWSLVTHARIKGALVSVWQALARHRLKHQAVTSKLGAKGSQTSFTVIAFAPGATVGAHAESAKKTGAPQVTLRAAARSQVWAVGHDTANGAARVLLTGEKLIRQLHSKAGREASWLQMMIARKAGRLRVGDRSPASKAWALSAVDVRQASTARIARAVRAALSVGVAGGNSSFGYNAEGDRTSVTTSSGTTTLGYDQANRLTTVGSSISYGYDGDSLRMSKTVNGATTQFAWDESGNLPLLLQDGSSSYIYGPNGQPIEQITGGTPTFLLSDQQGSTRLLTDSSGNVVGTYSYDAWGNVTSHTGSASTNLQYDGQYTDPETGYEYLRARYYDPSAGQFLSLDPASATTQMPFSFAGDEPLNEDDPTGLSFSFSVCFGGCLAWEDGHLGAGIGTVGVDNLKLGGSIIGYTNGNLEATVGVGNDRTGATAGGSYNIYTHVFSPEVCGGLAVTSGCVNLKTLTQSNSGYSPPQASPFVQNLVGGKLRDSQYGQALDFSLPATSYKMDAYLSDDFSAVCLLEPIS